MSGNRGIANEIVVLLLTVLVAIEDDNEEKQYETVWKLYCVIRDKSRI